MKEKTIEDFFKESHVNDTSIIALNGVIARDGHPGTEWERIKMAIESHANHVKAIALQEGQLLILNSLKEWVQQEINDTGTSNLGHSGQATIDTFNFILLKIKSIENEKTNQS
jgi:hypothetical protein